MYVELLHGEGLVSRMALDIFLVASLCVCTQFGRAI